MMNYSNMDKKEKVALKIQNIWRKKKKNLMILVITVVIFINTYLI